MGGGRSSFRPGKNVIFSQKIHFFQTKKFRSNIILASLAVCDMLFLLSFTPHSLAHFRIFYHNYYFRLLYSKFKIHMTAISNWASAASIWYFFNDLLICFAYKEHVRTQSGIFWWDIYGFVEHTGLGVKNGKISCWKSIPDEI